MKNKKKKILSVLLSAALVLSLLPSVTLTAQAATYYYDITNESHIIYVAGDYFLSGNSKAHNIEVLPNISGVVNITIDNLQIDKSSYYGGRDFAFIIGSNTTVNLTLNGTNILKGGGDYAGLQVCENATLYISGTGSLTAIGDIAMWGAAGIGGGKSGDSYGSDNHDSGRIYISGGTITAIGGGATEGNGGAGIGGGCYGSSAPITITGGTVTATGGGSAAGIGGGEGGGFARAGGCGGITITGSGTRVTARAGSYYTQPPNGGDKLPGGGYDIGTGRCGTYHGPLTIGSSETTANPPYVDFTSSDETPFSFKNCVIANGNNPEMSGTYNAEGYITTAVGLTIPQSVTVGSVFSKTVITVGNNDLKAAINGYSGDGYVQFSYKIQGDTGGFTNIGGPVPVSSGTASTKFLPNITEDYIIKADYYSPNSYRKGSATINVTVDDSALASLGISAGSLSPSFDLCQTNYTVNVGYDTPSLSVTPTMHDSNAKVTVNGDQVTNGSPSKSIALAAGSATEINVKVTAQDNNTTTTYKVTVNRALPHTDSSLSGLTLSSGAFSPEFTPGTTEYAMDVGYYIGSVTVTPTVNETHATVTVNGNAVTSGSPSASIALTEDQTTEIDVKVTAQDGTSSTTYKMMIYRGKSSSDSALAGLGLSSGTLNPSFTPGTTEYTASLDYDTDSITVTPTVDYPDSTVTVNGTAVTSGSASGSIALTAGTTSEINVMVTAKDGTKTTYKIKAKRAGDTSLAGLSISTGTLNPHFTSGTTNYAVTVYSSVPSVTVTPTVHSAGATVTVNGKAVASGAASGSITLTSGASTKIDIVVTARDGAKTTYSVSVTNFNPAQSIDVNSLQNLKAPTGVNQYQHVYYGGVYWRVLINFGNDIYLLTEDAVKSMAFRSDSQQSNSNQYQYSDVRAWITGPFMNSFSSLEQAAMNPNGSSYNDKIFLLPHNDVMYPPYFPGISGNACSSRSADVEWWTRDAQAQTTNKVGTVRSDGWDNLQSDNLLCSNSYGVRPGTVINLSSVLHASPAADGANPSVDSALTLAQQVTDNVKLTLLDSAKKLTVDSVTADNGKIGSTITVSYSGASTGTNQYLCVNLASGSSSYRGVIKALTASSGTATFTLPEDITSGQYSLRLWNEQYNAAQCTNYASALISKNITFNPSITREALPEGTIATSYQKTITASGGTAPYTWSATGLPKGLAIDANGKMSGTPEHDDSHDITAPYSVKITVTDSNGKTDTWDASLKINPESIALLSAVADGTDQSSVSTKIDFTFDKAVIGLTADNISITSGTGAAVKGTVTGAGTKWSIELSSVAVQGNVSVAISAPAGYTVTGSPVSVVVYAAPAHSITVQNDGNGTASANVNSASVGTEITLTAAPNDGFHFKEWQVISDGVTVEDSKFTMPDHAVTIKAVFEINPLAAHSITIQNDGNGTASSSVASALAGTEITLTAAPNNGYHFKEWQVVSGGVTVSDSKFTMPGNVVTVKAIFEVNAPDTYSVTVQNDGNGTASANVASAVSGTEITLTATPNNGYHFKEWQVVSGGVTVADSKFTMPDEAVTVKAIFEENTTSGITGFQKLSDAIRNQTVAVGTTVGSLNLPQKLQVIGNGITGLYVRVSQWVCSLFNSSVAGTYTFMPMLNNRYVDSGYVDSGYVLDSGVKLPEIKVTMAASSDGSKSDHHSEKNSAPSLPPVLKDIPTSTEADLTGAAFPSGVTEITLSATQAAQYGTNDPQAANTLRLAISDAKLGIIGVPVVYNLKLLDQSGNPITGFGGKVKVKIPIPLGMIGIPHVFRYEESAETFTDMVATVENGFLVFQTDHFSYYAVAGVGDSITLDTRSYQMPIKGKYQIGLKLTGSKATAVKVYSTNDKIATTVRLINGNVQVTGVGIGTAYIMIDVYDSKNKFLTHASVRVTVQNGVKANGNSARQYGIF
jgi:hypothetical protein